MYQFRTAKAILDKSIRPIMHPTQLLFHVVQTVTTERGHSFVCIPDRTAAEDELRKLRTCDFKNWTVTQH